MRSYRRLVLTLATDEEQELKSVGVVLRALALLRLSEGQSAAAVAANLELDAEGGSWNRTAVFGGRFDGAL